MSLAASLALVACTGVATLRWLRVAQFEHYLAGSCARFAARWLRTSAANAMLAIAGIAAAIVGVFVPVALLLAGAVVLAWPVGLGLRGRTKPLQWTRRLRTLAAIDAAVVGLIFAVLAALANAPVAACTVALTAPFALDLACALTRPFEELAASRYVRTARARLQSIEPRVVAITGSFGKTSTKEHLRDLLSGVRAVVASPASFNNRAGLSRTINDHLAPGTQVLIAEMGMYGPGEIADLCSWLQPEIAMITAIAPVHLERVGSIDRIVAAKREILVGARCAILNVDCEELARLATELEPTQRVVRCAGTTDAADVVVRREGNVVTVRTPLGAASATIADAAVEPTNLACAIAAAIELGVDLEAIERALPTLRSPTHRGTIAVSDAGVVVIDDSFSANVDGVERALRLLADADAARRIVVTPGMVELGRRQRDENAAFGEAAGKVADVVIIVGATNRSALRSGAAATSCELIEVRHREDAVTWVRAHAGRGDAVLYENDLPDHFP